MRSYRTLFAALLAASTTLGAQTAPAAATAAKSAELPIDRVVAIVGSHAITWSDLIESLSQMQAQGLKVPPDSTGQRELATQIVNQLIDDEVLIQKAKDEKVEVTDEEVAGGVDKQVQKVRGQFQSDAEFREGLKREGFGTPEEYRRWIRDAAKRQAMMQRVVDKLRTDGKIVPVSVTESDVTESFDKNRATLPQRPARITFRQIVVAPQASAVARATARAKAESLLAEIKRGGDFEQIARRESMDPASRETGGDLGWNRRGVMVREFEDVMFSLTPGQVSSVVETPFGYHIIRVDRVQPAEVKARHILIRPVYDSSSVAAARVRADSVVALWSAGAKYEDLSAKYHDRREESGSLQPFDRAQLPVSYAKATEGKGANTIVPPFTIDDKTNNVPKFVILQILTAQEGGEYTIADLRQQIREQLSQEKSIRRLLDSLRKQTYVAIRLDEALRAAGPGMTR